MKLKFKIVPMYSGAQMILLISKLRLDHSYSNLKLHSPYTIDVYQPRQVLKLGRYGECLKKL